SFPTRRSSDLRTTDRVSAAMSLDPPVQITFGNEKTATNRRGLRVVVGSGCGRSASPDSHLSMIRDLGRVAAHTHFIALGSHEVTSFQSFNGPPALYQKWA